MNRKQLKPNALRLSNRIAERLQQASAEVSSQRATQADPSAVLPIKKDPSSRLVILTASMLRAFFILSLINAGTSLGQQWPYYFWPSTCNSRHAGWISVSGVVKCIPKYSPSDSQALQASDVADTASSVSGLSGGRSSASSPYTQSSPSSNQYTQSSTTTVTGGVNHYGPRGGCYQYNSKGNKDYSKC